MQMEDTDTDRQTAELVLLQSMYPSELTFPTSSNSIPDLTQPDAHASFSLRLNDDYTLELDLPETYPSTLLPKAYLTCSPQVSTQTRKRARALLSETLNSLSPGTECIDVLAQTMTEKLSALEEEEQDHRAKRSDMKSKEQKTQTRYKTALLWSHHLLATSKRKDIVSWSRELRLEGYSRPGYPGAILIEGEEDDVHEFVIRIKELRWQALQVRGEEVSERRRLGECAGHGVKEVESLGDLAEELKARDKALAEWFLEGMKIGH